MRRTLYLCLVLLPTLHSPTAIAAPPTNEVFAFVGARVYVSPYDSPLVDGVVVVANGTISQVGGKDAVQVPRDARIIDCNGKTLTAGFWNSHVHFIEAKWNDAAGLEAPVLTSQLESMLTRYGFVYVFETATFKRATTLALRRRIARGEVDGPTIYTTGVPFVPPNGTPAYLAPLEIQLPEVATAADAERLVRAEIGAGSDGIKFWTASPVSMSTVLTIPVGVARHAIAIAHELRRPVFAHPTNVAGVRIAAQSGVDVLAHTSPDNLEEWSEELVEALKAANIALTPTLKLYQWDPARQGLPPAMVEKVVNTAVQQLRQYSAAGGTVLFGTDVGYVTDYDPTAEYLLMRRAGLDFRQILASLTTAPAGKFGAADRTGAIRPGMDADLVVLGSDPAAHLEAFADVQFVYAKGRRIYPSALTDARNGER